MSEPGPVENATTPAEDRSKPWFVATPTALAREIGRLHKAEATGDLAALRRFSDKGSVAPALFRLLARALPDQNQISTDVIKRYAVIAQMMAQRPEALRAGSLGAALHKARFSEQRVAMLLNARGSTFLDLARRTARRLAGAELSALPYGELASLILLDGRETYDMKADDIRIGIARDYQRAEYTASKTD